MRSIPDTQHAKAYSTPIVVSVIDDCVDKGAIINTDDSTVYRNKLKDFAAHRVVNHSAKEYVLRMPDGNHAHVNTCEGFFSLLKRGVVGSWHHISREHTPKYAGGICISLESPLRDRRGAICQSCRKRGRKAPHIPPVRLTVALGAASGLPCKTQRRHLRLGGEALP